MGLDDIDECVPPSLGGKGQVLKGRPVKNGDGISGSCEKVNFGDLFGVPVESNGGAVMPSVSAGVGSVQAGSTTQCQEPEEQWTWVSAEGQKNNTSTVDNMTGRSNDPLDAFFTSHTPSLQPSSSMKREEKPPTDLLDFSKPAERVRYSDEHSLLEAFENQSKGRRADMRDGPSLEDLSHGSSNNAVKARLLKIMNYYDILGVTRDATEEQIRQRYKQKALELHPDRVGRGQTPEEVELFKVMTKANEVLCNPEERAKYDEELRCSNVGADDEAQWLFHLHLR
ncbi:DnaJ chaperone protein, putative [Trypanosoma cruzi marinkellei]|uniref:DnaJ chaperone protein, putative n=1 Tax=Trypanosoma cruzi marinkellei TaxID=85056 RepID=K2MQ51_TRYCR|nr:DnaJ chaperone protein, putative [Trypanosoma cruzi marinkellei]